VHNCENTLIVKRWSLIWLGVTTFSWPNNWWHAGWKRL